MKELVNQDPKNYFIQVQDLLCSFMKHRTEEVNELYNMQFTDTDGKLEQLNYMDRSRTTDIGTAMACLGAVRSEVWPYHAMENRPVLDEVNLRECEFPQSTLIGLELKKGILEKAKLQNSDLRKADLSGTNLSRTDMQSTRLEGANFTDANMEKADLRYANTIPGVRAAFLIMAFLTIVVAIGFAPAYLNLISVEIAFFSFVVLVIAALTMIITLKNNIDNVITSFCSSVPLLKRLAPATPEFKRTNLTEAKMRFADLAFTEFERANLTSTNLRKANLWKAKFNFAILNNTDFTGANLTGATFEDAKTTGAKVEQKWRKLFRQEQWNDIEVVNKDGLPILNSTAEIAEQPESGTGELKLEDN
ncbi:pentapeptide repeat-containing protein [Pseudovibrio ascidiaceicola]|uniref:pentapeptide repeat-containing protein n=1 Tax=Pseudovibrio ascidiaceicola TaxID=285279 RepID=UPI0013580476|nr:pentapeptide repeat-containing protein [Pseudovibrio ascidiaceicola]